MEDLSSGGREGWNGKERKSKNILMFEKRVEMNKIRYGDTRGGKLVIVRAKVIAWSHVMHCGGGEEEGGEGPLVKLSNQIDTEPVCSVRRRIIGHYNPFCEHIIIHTYEKYKIIISDLRG